MATIGKATFFFNSTRGTGESESWYYVAPSRGITVMMTDAIYLAGLRQRLLGPGSKLVYIRCSMEDAKGLTLVSIGPDPTQNGGPSSANPMPSSDTPWQTLNLRCQAGEQNHSVRYLVGFPDAFIVAGDLDRAATSTLGFDQRFNEWKKELKTNWGIKGVLRTGIYTPAAITAATTTDLTHLQITSALGAIPVVGDKIAISGLQMTQGSGPSGKSIVNGVFTVTISAAPTYTVVGKFADYANPWLGGGTARKFAKGFVAVTALDYLRPGRRARGPGGLALRGRRKARKTS